MAFRKHLPHSPGAGQPGQPAAGASATEVSRGQAQSCMQRGGSCPSLSKCKAPPCQQPEWQGADPAPSPGCGTSSWGAGCALHRNEGKLMQKNHANPSPRSNGASVLAPAGRFAGQNWSYPRARQFQLPLCSRSKFPSVGLWVGSGVGAVHVWTPNV